MSTGKQARNVQPEPTKVTRVNAHQLDRDVPRQSHNTNINSSHAHQKTDNNILTAADDRRGSDASHTTQDAKSSMGQKEKKVVKIDQKDVARLVAEENEIKGKLPKYPGLERWEIIDKMGDGAFSNVYRAKDLEGEYGEVAIKVVHKYEMNSNQVSI